LPWPRQIPLIDGVIPAGGGSLYFRESGQGIPIVVLHGGPDFDHRYLLPELDILSTSFRLIYYDQRGRGKSIGQTRPEDVTIESEIADLEAVRRHLGLDEIVVLGHSWGGLLAMEYGIRHSDRTSHLILLNTAPASRNDYLLLREEWARQKDQSQTDEMNALIGTDRFTMGDPETMKDLYRIHFRPTVPDPRLLDDLLDRMLSEATHESILLAREIERRLRDETWLHEGYDLLPALRQFERPVLILYGEGEFIPFECSRHIADALPASSLVTIPGSGHFSYCERPEAVRLAIESFIESPPARVGGEGYGRG
jgi:proline iminopeptidase